MAKTKPFAISKRAVWEAYKRVKKNGGAAGVDDQSLAEFEEKLSDNLYKLWNRLASGSYFPPPVKRVEIPKSDGGKRPLGIPTVADRIAQAVIKAELEPELEKHFHEHSYGYRPNKSALQAIGVARRRCWRRAWVLDLDIRAFFDRIDHNLLMRAVRKHTGNAWVLLYIERWLKAPIQLPDGSLERRERGSPQGSVISPLLANLFLHYAFDKWMGDHHPHIWFERFADDICCHCTSLEQAEWLKTTLEQRFDDCKLELHPGKTKIVYCQDSNRRLDYPVISFDFLGYTFRARRAKSHRDKYFMSFCPAISNQAAKRIRQEIKSWRLRRRSDKRINDLARMFNPVIRGWITYYGGYFKSALYPIFRYLDRRLACWAMNKYKRLRRRGRRADQWIAAIAWRNPRLFAHWCLTKCATA